MSDCSVLVVDDEEAIREMITLALEVEGYAVAAARDGLEAIRELEAIRTIDPERPSLILLDMRMPRLHGWGFAREMRSRGLACRIVVMTAAQDARAWAEDIGADSYLAKPFSVDALLTTVAQFTGNRGG